MPSLKDVFWRSGHQDLAIRKAGSLSLVLGGVAFAEGVGWLGDGGPLVQIALGVAGIILGPWLWKMHGTDRR